MRPQQLTRYLIAHGDSRMNVLLDRHVSKGALVTLKDVEGYWIVLERYETLEAHSVKRGWNNNI